MKQEFHELVLNQVDALDTPIEEFTLHTDLFYKNPSCDGRNIVPMVEKFVLDALQGPIITNDNVKCDKGGSWAVVEQDKLNPRVEITLTEKETNEKITDRD